MAAPVRWPISAGHTILRADRGLGIVRGHRPFAQIISGLVSGVGAGAEVRAGGLNLARAYSMA